MATVDVPGVGPVEKKYVVGGLVVAVGIAAWFWIRGRTPGASTADPTIDPLTGLPYSSEDQAQTGYVNPNPVQSVIDGTGGAISTNTAWTADVIEKLGNIGLDAGYVGGVLGKYLGHQALSLDEAAVVRTAWAFAGKPPQGPDNFTLTTGTSNPGGTTPPPAEHKNPATASVLPGWYVDQWVRDMQAHGINVIWDQIEQLNPNIWQNIRKGPNGDHTKNTFIAAKTYALPGPH